jgi:uncharacterized DUF497 family protein
MRFEWDADKASSNFVKHSVTFNEATEVFYDPKAVEGFDALHSDNETRLFVIGFSTRRLLFVVFVETVQNVMRLISARKANKREREIYERRFK